MLSKRSGRKRMASERKDQVESGEEEETDKMEETYSTVLKKKLLHDSIETPTPVGMELPSPRSGSESCRRQT